MLVSCDVGNDKNTTETSNSSNPDLCAPAPIQPSGGTIAYANWQAQNLRLQLIGKRVDVGKSDTKFEIIDTRLLLMKQDASCVFSQVHIGELTRHLPEKGDKPVSNKSIPLELPIESLGVLEGNSIPIVAFEQIQLSEDTFLMFIYQQREVKWGLTEYYATLVTIKEQHMVAGDRVLIGRDAIQPPVYYGEFKVINKDGISQLVLTRTGKGSFVNKVAFSKDTFGAYRCNSIRRKIIN